MRRHGCSKKKFYFKILSVGEGSGDLLRSPAGPGQSPSRGSRKTNPTPTPVSSGGLRNYRHLFEQFPSPMHTPPNPKSWIRPWLQRRRIKKKLPIRNKNCLWWPCLLTDWNKMGNRYRGPSIDASYHVSVHLAKRFKRRIFFKSTNQKQELPVVVMFVNESGQYEQIV
jgi:hypothetical protein